MNGNINAENMLASNVIQPKLLVAFTILHKYHQQTYCDRTIRTLYTFCTAGRSRKSSSFNASIIHSHRLE